MGEAFLFGNGGGSGFPVTVRHCGANAIVTAYSGGKTESATANADGVAVFEKLAKGVWVFANTSTQKIVEIRAKTEFGFEDTDEIIPTPMNGLIVYSAPVGLTVTATKGGESLKVTKTIVGDKELHCFVVKHSQLGEWTITAGDKVQTVTVDSNITVTITYALDLYNPVSMQFVDAMKRVLGVSSSVDILTPYEGYFTYRTDFAALFTANKYDVSNYSKLCFDYEDNSNASTQTFVLGLSEQNSQPSGTYYQYKLTKNPTKATSRTTAIVDISTVDHSKTYYIGFTKYHQTGQGTITCYRLWLE